MKVADLNINQSLKTKRILLHLAYLLEEKVKNKNCNCKEHYNGIIKDAYELNDFFNKKIQAYKDARE